MARQSRLAILDSRYLTLLVYGAFTVGGCIFIAMARLNGIGPDIVITVAVILMIGYMLASIGFGRLRLHDEQTGDNLYYMGFLFTLTSLAVTLYQFDAGGAADTEEIVRNFSVAVISTIAGIALRIFYNQMRRDPLDIERTARHELAEVSRRVRHELDSVAREFADFRRVSNQMLQEGFEEIAVQAKQNGEHIRFSLEKMAEEAILPVKEASGKFGKAMEENVTGIETRFGEIVQKVDSAAQLLDSANSAMSSSVSRLGEQADTVAGKLGQVVIPDEVLKNDLAPMVKTLGNAVAQYAAHTETASKEQQERMAVIAAAIEKIVEQAQRTAAAAEKTAEAVASQQRVTEVLVRAVHKQSQETKEMVASLLEKAEQPQAVAPASPTPPHGSGTFEPIAAPAEPSEVAGWRRLWR